MITRMLIPKFTSPAFPPFLLLLLLLPFVVTLEGCTFGFATLKGVVTEGQAVQFIQGNEIQIWRKNKPLKVEPGMSLEADDRIVTGPTSSALIKFSGGGEAALRPNTRIRILNPSIFVEIGEVFLRIKGAFQVKTRYITAGSEGTEFVVKVSESDQATVTVLESSVTVTSVSNSWQSLRLKEREQTVVAARSLPITRVLSRDEFNHYVDWVNDVFRAVDKASSLKLIVPDLTSLSLNSVRQLLLKEDLQLGGVQHQITRRASVGTVISQTPMTNVRVRPGTAVSVVLEAEPTNVPRVTGLQQNRAQERLRSAKLQLGEVYTELNNAPPGQVFRQNPAAGQRVMTHSQVDLWVSAPQVRVPELQGRALSQAQAILSRNNLTLGQVNERITGSVSVGTVLSQQPAAGTRVVPQAVVDLEVEANSVVVPQLVGIEDGDTAARRLRNQQLNIGTIRQQRQVGIPAGRILQQTPPAGSRVPMGSRVDLVVSSDLVVLPNLIGLNIHSAEQMLNGIKLRVSNINTRLTDQFADNTVVEQRPYPGTEVDPGSLVSLVVALQGVRVPELYGLHISVAQARASGSGLNLSSSQRPSETHQNDTVMDQHPTPGVMVRRGETVHVTVATQYRRQNCVVPNVVRMGWVPAQATLKELGFVAIPVGNERADQPAIEQDPRAGTPLECGSRVSVVFPKQPQPVPQLQFCTVPNVIGMSWPSARNALNSFNVVSTGDGGQVVRQEPSAGTQIPCGSQVTVSFPIN